MRILVFLLAVLAPGTASAVVVDLAELPGSGAPVANGSVLSDQWRPAGILFSARTEGGDPIVPIAEDFGTGEKHLFFSPDLLGAVAVFDFVLPGTSTPVDLRYFALVPYFEVGESAALVGLDEMGDVVEQDDFTATEVGDRPMSIGGRLRRVEWRTAGNPGIAARELVFAPTGLCAAAPVDGCIAAGKASLSVQEKKPGSEKLKLSISAFEAATTRPDFGDPVDGQTWYDACLYGAAGELVAELVVARPGDPCGSKGTPCWKPKKTTGWSFKDASAVSSGVRSLALGSGPAGKGKLGLQAGNQAKKGQTQLPTGIAAALQGAASARVQLLARDAACFDAALGTVKQADGLQFKATAP